MDSIQHCEKLIDSKIKLLNRVNKKAEEILGTKQCIEVERHAKLFITKMEEIEELKTKVIELKYMENEEDDIDAWEKQLDDKLEPLKDQLAKFQQERRKIISEEEDLERNKREREIRSQNEEKKNLEYEIEKMKLDLRSKYDSTPKDEKAEIAKVKLPKLVISKFQATHLDWLRFWNEFDAEIEKSALPAVSKFSYLKELLIPKAKLLINGLPFNAEGYERAKTILETTYGRPTEVAKAHVQGIMGLPTINHHNVSKIHEFYEKLLINVQSLETMGKLKQIDGYVQITLDKLPTIRADLVRLDHQWQDWTFPKLVEALREWTVRNPLSSQDLRKDHASRQEKLLQTSQKRSRCVYCDGKDHVSNGCDKVKTADARKRILKEKKLCFNCTGWKHSAAECRSTRSCSKCNQRHHTSICSKMEITPTLTSFEEDSVIYPVVVVLINGIKCRALLDSAAGSSYISSTVAQLLNKPPVRKQTKRIEMMMNSATRTIEIYEATVENLARTFSIEVELSKVERKTLLSLPNPRYADLIQRYQHLQGVFMDDTDTKPELPIHAILGVGEYSSIKTSTMIKIGRKGEPVAEKTHLGWTITSPGKERDLTNIMLTRNSTCDYDQLCRLDVLGIEDNPTGDQMHVYQEFQEQLERKPDGSYQTSLLWKPGHPPLNNNKSGSISRLKNLVRKLQRQPKEFEQYDEIIQAQLAEGIIEKAPEDVKGNEFYIPHKAVFNQDSETTKMRIVYDASAKPTSSSPSLNECLETGPSLQNLLWNVLIRNRFSPIALCGDIKKAFLQVHIKEEDRDALRFHWIKNKDPNQIETYRFTRALFGLGQSPFILGGTIKNHLDESKNEHPTEVEEIEKGMYVDDIISGGETIPEVHHLKHSMMLILGEAKFQLHKWHSNVAELEDNHVGNDQTYAKSQLGVKPKETKILGVLWNKSTDEIAVTFPETSVASTKRGILQKLASCYDPIGLAAPILLVGKSIYRNCCDLGVSWDQPLPEDNKRKWEKWQSGLPLSIIAPRAFLLKQESVISIDIHAFSDASLTGTAAAIYAVIHQPTQVVQGLITAKSRLSKKDLTIPRLELVAMHMAANLCQNLKTALKGKPIQNFYGWTDSSVALHWVRGKGNYKQFVNNRVKEMQKKSYIQWRYVPTEENPADVASRGCSPKNLPANWLTGPAWLKDQSVWPEDIVTVATNETEVEAKIIKEIFSTAVIGEDHHIQVLSKYSLWKTLRINSWVRRFIDNCKKSRKERTSGPLTTIEIEHQLQEMIKTIQKASEESSYFKDHQLVLNLQKDNNGLYRCRGRIQGEFPIYIPNDSLLAEKIVQDAHIRTIHGGVGLTMAEVRELYWIPKLRSLVKRIRKNCHGCKRFQVTAFAEPPPGLLPLDRTTGSRAFQVIGVDYAGPLVYKTRFNRLKKAYILLFSCSLTRAIHLQGLQEQTTEEFIRALKLFIARRGRPQKIYSDNAKTFTAAAKWIKNVVNSEKFNDFLAQHKIQWQFNLSRAPWWGGQFERLIGITKNTLYKCVGKSQLSWKEFAEVLLDIEITLNNRPLMYVEDDVQLPLLTPNVMIHGENIANLEEHPDNMEDKDHDLRKRAKYLKRCKDQAWVRWTNEYLKSLREQHNLNHKSSGNAIEPGDVVLIKGDEKNRGKWNIGIIEKLNRGRDGILRSVRLRTGKSILERAVQHLYPMELSVDGEQNPDHDELKPTSSESRPKRSEAVAARMRINEATSYENELPDIE